MRSSFRCLSVRTLVAALALTVAASLWLGAAPPAVEANQSRLAFISSSTWTTDPERGRVHVLASVSATSRTVDSGGRRYYYDRVQLTVPAFSADFVATTTDGISLPASVVPATSPNVTLVVGLGKRLYSGQDTSFDLKALDRSKFCS